MYAIKVVPNKKKPEDWFLLRDAKDFTVFVWSRKEVAEAKLKILQADLSKNMLLELTEDIAPATLNRAVEKKKNEPI